MPDTIERDKLVRRVILIEGAANLFVLTVKVVVGLATGSLAVLGDAIHSLTDLANNVVAWVVVNLSRQPADRKHPYGHRKFETLAVFGLAALLTVLAFELAFRAIQRDDVAIISEPWGLWLMFVVLGVNVGVAVWERAWARRLDSVILLADSSHTLADVLITLTVIGGWQLSAMGHVWLDRVCAVGVAGLVFYFACNLFRRVAPVLVDEVAVDPEKLTRTIRSVPGVQAVLQVRSRWMGSTRAVDMIITVDPDLSTLESHEIADRIEALLEAQFQVRDVSIHVEPGGG